MGGSQDLSKAASLRLRRAPIDYPPLAILALYAIKSRAAAQFDQIAARVVLSAFCVLYFVTLRMKDASVTSNDMVTLHRA